MRHMIDEAITTSPTEFLITTRCSRQDWEDKLTEVIRDTPAMATFRVKWRQVHANGRAWAKPCMLDEDIRATRRNGGGRRLREPEGLGQISIRGFLGAQPDRTLRALMQAISQVSGRPLVETESDGPLQVGQWRLLLQHDGSPSGLIDFRLSSDLEVRQLHQEVGKDVVQINGCILPVQILGDALVSGAFRPRN